MKLQFFILVSVILFRVISPFVILSNYDLGMISEVPLPEVTVDGVEDAPEIEKDSGESVQENEDALIKKAAYLLENLRDSDEIVEEDCTSSL